jgi:hypothetical protein
MLFQYSNSFFLGPIANRNSEYQNYKGSAHLWQWEEKKEWFTNVVLLFQQHWADSPGRIQPGTNQASREI